MATENAPATTGGGFGATNRTDNWWVAPLATALGLGAFGVYSTIRAFANADFLAEEGSHLLSPFYSPHIVLPAKWAWISPAFLILWAPGGFRLTCYYYRKAYYRSFFLDPPACAVGEPRTRYSGETRLFLFQNLHRFFLYLALVFVVILSIDVVHASIWYAPDGSREFGISVGTLVLAMCTTLLTLYTFSCHSLRHLIGGNVDCFSCVAFGNSRHALWTGVTKLNQHHMFWAWTSLFMVGFADLYVWLVASGTITDLRIL